jgi:hypothetical protein
MGILIWVESGELERTWQLLNMRSVLTQNLLIATEGGHDSM